MRVLYRSVQRTPALVDDRRVDLPGHTQDGRGACERCGERGGGVENPRAGDHHERADLAGRTREAVRHVSGRLLMPGVKHLVVVTFFPDCIEEVVELDPGESEERLDALQLERLRERLSAGHLHRSTSAVIAPTCRLVRPDHTRSASGTRPPSPPSARDPPPTHGHSLPTT